ncbi:hypothetical protein RR48_06806 [Papilio machaon]|uniref:Uncharacterized protein n=1 Tax=Papilio machaon TaxID=76193 RepID=A0A194R662_PAPMA|nr:hypothetical protein RR48_06806 [Papilio machaon]
MKYDGKSMRYRRLCNLTSGSKLRVKSHYRGHKMALWLHLIPQLHRPGAAPRHHQFRAAHPDMFAGNCRTLTAHRYCTPQSMVCSIVVNSIRTIENLSQCSSLTGDIFPELYTTTTALDDDEEEEGEETSVGLEGSEGAECSPPPPPPALSPARPALAAGPESPAPPRDDSLTNVDTQYYR